MKYDQGDPAELREKFWKALSDSPFLMLQRDADRSHCVPMTAQLDKDANHAIWFFTSRENDFAKLGAVTAIYSSKGHDVFAQFHGTLAEETDRARLDKQWNNWVEAWFPGGKDDPHLLMVRMDLGEAAIWAGELGVLNTVKASLGLNVTDTIKGGYTETKL